MPHPSAAPGPHRPIHKGPGALITRSARVSDHVRLYALSRLGAVVMQANGQTWLLIAPVDGLQASRTYADERATNDSSVSRERAPVPGHRAETDLGPRDRRCRLCRCVLSRYNEEPFCSGCSRIEQRRPQPTPSVPSDVWSRTDIQSALLARDFGRFCHLVRVASGLRQSDIAELTGLSQAFLSMLESGARRLTNIDKIVELLAGLKTPVELTGPMLRIPTWMDDRNV
ncbi:helix-turn-helix domain-containing protein [Streptomyces sp. NPDC001155]